MLVGSRSNRMNERGNERVSFWRCMISAEHLDGTQVRELGWLCDSVDALGAFGRVLRSYTIGPVGCWCWCESPANAGGGGSTLTVKMCSCRRVNSDLTNLPRFSCSEDNTRYGRIPAVGGRIDSSDTRSSFREENSKRSVSLKGTQEDEPSVLLIASEFGKIAIASRCGAFGANKLIRAAVLSHMRITVHQKSVGGAEYRYIS